MIKKRIMNFIYFLKGKVIKFKYKNIGKNLMVKENSKIEVSKLKCGDNVTIYEGVHFWGSGEIIIGNNTSIGEGTIIFAKERVFIGDDCLIAGQCYIIDSDHGIDGNNLIRLQKMVSNPIFINNDVWISAGVKVLKGVNIGKGAVIGAMSLVSRNVEPNSINVGIPTRRIRERL